MTLATEAAARGIDVETQVTAWAYRCIGGHFAAPSLVAVWLLCQMNATERLDSVLRTLGEDWRERTPGEIGEELFARIMAHPESVEVARQDPATNLEDNIGYDDGLIRLAPAPMVEELQRALNDGDDEDKDYPIVLAGGLRTRWTANTIQRDPAWRRGKGPHCPVNISAEDAQSLGLRQGDRVRVETRRASLELPAVVDENLRSGHAWIPNGFGTLYSDSIEGPVEVVGVNCNELMDISERDPITGIPHTKALRCRISAA